MKLIRPILCFFLSMLVLVSSTSFMVGMHRCNGEIKEITFLTHADGCGHTDNVPPCHKQEQKSCCEDGDVLHEATDLNAQLSKVDLHVDAAGFLCPISDVVVSIVVPEPAASYSIKFIDHDIPILIEDLSVANRVLLI